MTQTLQMGINPETQPIFKQVEHWIKTRSTALVRISLLITLRLGIPLL